VATKASDVDEEKYVVDLPTRLNGVPMERSVRRYFYRCTIPELNPEMDVFRVGTLLEMVRDIAEALAEDGKGVKVCVQQAMGQGVFQGIPLSLSGVRKIMERMDWGEVADFVTFGNIKASTIDDATYYILVTPQNVVGNTIMDPLIEMVDAAEAQNKHVILVNPLLKDIPSSAGVMQVRGRKERMAFEDSFAIAYHFRLLYLSSQCIYPVMGALRKVYHHDQWQVFRRADRPDLGKREEEYQLLGEFLKEPGAAEITPLFAPKPKAPTWKTYWKP